MGIFLCYVSLPECKLLLEVNDHQMNALLPWLGVEPWSNDRRLKVQTALVCHPISSPLFFGWQRGLVGWLVGCLVGFDSYVCEYVLIFTPTLGEGSKPFDVFQLGWSHHRIPCCSLMSLDTHTPRSIILARVAWIKRAEGAGDLRQFVEPPLLESDTKRRIKKQCDVTTAWWRIFGCTVLSNYIVFCIVMLKRLRD